MVSQQIQVGIVLLVFTCPCSDVDGHYVNEFDTNDFHYGYAYEAGGIWLK